MSGAVHTVPLDLQYAHSGYDLVFSPEHHNAISIASSSSPVQVTLSVSDGDLTLPSTTGLTFGSGDGSHDATMTFQGSVANINSALDGLDYAPGESCGADTLSFSTFVDNTPSASQVSIAIGPDEDPEVYASPCSGELDIYYGETLTISGTETGVWVDDADDGVLTVTLGVDRGALSLSSQSWTLDYQHWNGSSEVTLTGKTEEINKALDGMVYVPSLGQDWQDDDLQISVDDGYGGTDAGSVSLVAQNAAPSSLTLTLGGPIPEGSTACLTGHFFDPDNQDTHALTVDWGDGTSGTLGLTAGLTSFTIQNHHYAQNGQYPVQVTVEDQDSETTSQTTTATVQNVAPTGVSATFVPSTLNEGGPGASVTVAFTDPGTDDSHTVTVDWGEGDPDTFSLDSCTLSFSFQGHQYAQSDVYTVQVTVVDSDGGSGSLATTMSVANVAPEVTSLDLSSHALSEGETVSLQGWFSDPGTVDAHVVTVDWGDNTSLDVTELTAGETYFAAPEHQYVQDGEYTVSVTVTDQDDGMGTDTVTVENVAPYDVSLSGQETLAEGQTLSLEGSFADPGSQDVHTVSIDWGDGRTADPVTISAGTLSFPVQEHQYVQDGTYTVSVVVADECEGSEPAMATVTVNNVQPSSLTLSLTDTIWEGSAVSGAAVFADPGEDDAHTVTVDWGDETTQDVTELGAGETSFPMPEHTYVDNGTYSLTVAVADDDETVSWTQDVTVANAVPSDLSVALSDPIYEGDTVTLGGTFTDPGALDAHTVTVVWGDSTAPDAVTLTASETGFDFQGHQYVQDGQYSVQVAVADEDGGTVSWSACVTVANVDPSVSFTLATPSATLYEGDAITLSGTVSDPGPNDPHTITVDWGDETSPDVLSLDATVSTFEMPTHVYAQNGDYVIQVGVTDSDGGSCLETVTASAANAAPTITSLSLSYTSFPENDLTSLEGWFSDPGTLDAHVVTVDWGDSRTLDVMTLSAEETYFAAPEHQYLQDGEYTVSVTVTDQDDGVATDTVTVENVPPSDVCLSPSAETLDEGQVISLEGSFADPGSQDAHTVTIDWGDGAAAEVTTVSAGTLSFPAQEHQYVQDGTYTVSVVVSDEWAGSDPALTTVTVNNVEPSAATLSSRAEDGNTAWLRVVFTDPGEADTHTVTIDWGDGTTTSPSLGPGDTNRAWEHVYAESGSYTLEAIVADEHATACSSGAQLDMEFELTTSSNSPGYNSWDDRIMAPAPGYNFDDAYDPSNARTIIYRNSSCQTMLRLTEQLGDGRGWNSEIDEESNKWYDFTAYDAQDRVCLQASGPAVTGFDDTYADLLAWGSWAEFYDDYYYLADNAGLIETTEYYSQTCSNISETYSGGVAGYVLHTWIMNGEIGTPILQSTTDYYRHQYSSTCSYPVANYTVYANGDGTGARTTHYTYTWFTNSSQVEMETVCSPAVDGTHNGSDVSTSETTVYDSSGRPIWTKDAGGFLTYTAYDSNGNVTKTITDVDTSISVGTNDRRYFSTDLLPSGWSTPAGGGSHLVTTYEVDSAGRTTNETDPNGVVTYTVYRHNGNEVRTYSGWNATTHTTIGPTQVTRTDATNGYTEVLTMAAAPSRDPQGRPTGTERISNIQSLWRTYTDSEGRITETREYFNLSGVTYETNPSLGTAGVNYYSTTYAYDSHGNLVRTEDPSGAITRTVYDWLDREGATWIGTDDVPTCGAWSPTNTCGTDMVNVSEYVYDGAGNLVQTKQFVDSCSEHALTTDYQYDWRDRMTGVRGPDDVAVRYTYDNLDETTLTETYADTNEDFVIDSGTLRAKTETLYDELGRPYRTTVYEVNQSTGAVGDGLASDFWYDPRGYVIKTSDPAGMFQKTQYDGAGRLVASYASFDSSETAYDAADDVVDDTILSVTQTIYDGDRMSEVKQGTSLSNAVPVEKYWYDTNGDGTGDLTARLTGVSTLKPNSMTAGANDYVLTAYGYDSGGRLARTVDPAGTISRTVYDMLSRVKSTWVGTDDTVTGDWSPTNPGGMVEVTENIYDDSSGNIAQTKQFYASGEAYVTDYKYDGIGRLTDVRGADDVAVRYTYDNIDQVVAELTYADSNRDFQIDNVELRGKTEYLSSSDSLGEIRETRVYEVDQATGQETCSYLTYKVWYDARGLQTRATDPAGMFTEAVYDALGNPVLICQGYGENTVLSVTMYVREDGRLTQVEQGTTLNNTVPVVKYWYDSDADGSGDFTGRLTGVSTLKPDATGFTESDYVTTRYGYDDRGRQSVVIAPDQETWTGTEYDLLGDVLSVKTYNQLDPENPDPENDPVLSCSESSHDVAGRLLSTKVYEDPDCSNSDYLETTYTYDGLGRLVKTTYPGGAFTKTIYNPYGRVLGTYLGTDAGEQEEPTIDPDEIADQLSDDTIVSQAIPFYDAAGRVWMTQTYARFPDACGDGALTSSNARVTYDVVWFDDMGRTKWSATYGTNGGTEIENQSYDFNGNGAGTGYWSPGSTGKADMTDRTTANAGSYILTQYAYDGYGRNNSVTDNADRKTRYFFDAAGRTTYVVENYQNFGFDTCGSPINTGGGMNHDQDRVTAYVYNSAGLLTQMKALDSNGDGSTTTGDDQVTSYVYAMDLDGDHQGSPIPDGSLLRAVSYPDGTSRSNVITALEGTCSATDFQEFTYNAAGLTATFRDQAGTTHEYSYDDLGRLTQDSATALGDDVDDTVQAITYEYDSWGRVSKVTSWACSDACGTIRNEVHYHYDGWGNVIQAYQSHDGAVDDDLCGEDTPYVAYAYGSASQGVRLESVTYPDGREVFYNYGDTGSIDDVLSLVDDIASSATPCSTDIFAQYAYLGDGTIVGVAHPAVCGGLNLTYGSPDPQTGEYPGLDRFGRVIDQKWQTDGSSPTVLDEYAYGYDAAGNRTFRQNVVACGQGLDELYSYDALARLTGLERGALTENNGVLDILCSTFTQGWTLDQLGNWHDTTTQVGQCSPVAQTRTHDAANQICSIDQCSAGLSYDDAGNMTGDGTLTYTYDAWNRLTEADLGENVVAVYNYDGVNRRVSKAVAVRDACGTLTGYDRTDYEYDEAWQVLEERLAANACSAEAVATAPHAQYVWDLRYIDAPVLRIRDTAGPSCGEPDGDLGDAGDEVLYYTTDANMNVTALVNPEGEVVERYAYEAYGTPTVLNGAAGADPDTCSCSNPQVLEWSADPDGASDVGNEILFAGYRYNYETGNFHVRNREYSPTLGRWVQRDPIGYNGGSANLVEYVAGHPINSTDALGLEETPTVKEFLEVKSIEALQALVKKAMEKKAAIDTYKQLGQDLKDIIQLNDKFITFMAKLASYETLDGAACGAQTLAVNVGVVLLKREAYKQYLAIKAQIAAGHGGPFPVSTASWEESQRFAAGQLGNPDLGWRTRAAINDSKFKEGIKPVNDYFQQLLTHPNDVKRVTLTPEQVKEWEKLAAEQKALEDRIAKLQTTQPAGPTTRPSRSKGPATQQSIPNRPAVRPARPTTLPTTLPATPRSPNGVQQ